MNKGFYLAVAFAGRSNLLQAQLTRQNAAFHTCSSSKIYTAAVSDGHLRAGMQRQLRHNFACQADNAQILHDETVYTHVVQKQKVLRQLLQLAVIHQRINRYI